MTQKINWLKILGFVYVVSATIFIVLFSDFFFYEERLKTYLFDFGVNSIGSLISVGVFFGCIRQEESGSKTFRALLITVTTCFLCNEMMLFTMNVPEWKTICFILCIVDKILDIVLIYLFYFYIKNLLEFEGKVFNIVNKILPVLIILEILVILSNIFYPLTFYLNAQGEYMKTSIAWIEDIALVTTILTALIFILLSHCPLRQKISAFSFALFPVIGYLIIAGEFGSASQYGFVLMSLIVMYSIIFNDKNKKLMATATELNMASEIQTNVLPSNFPAFPERNEFDIYASMTPAKEVGGDFYDFFLIDDDHLAIVIADVSGKGVPAALFMMSSKILINDHCLMGGTPSQILERVNKAVYANNKAHMFVTVWLGILEISTGKLITSNAGHEYPLINVNGQYQIFKDKHGIAIGAMNSSKYIDMEIDLKKGDCIFVYTDGVAEATNANKHFFGVERTLEALNNIKEDVSQEEVLKYVKEAVDGFVKEAPQFDDITMVGLKYNGPSSKEDNNFKELVVKADTNNLDKVQLFIDEELEKVDCPMKIQTTIDIAVEELFVNIANYAYGEDSGEVIVQVKMNEDPLSIEITFIDSGKEYNPIKKPDPNTSLSLMERQKGGLGIFMVKKSMDDMTYEYVDNKNVLKIVKKI